MAEALTSSPGLAGKESDQSQASTSTDIHRMESLSHGPQTQTQTPADESDDDHAHCDTPTNNGETSEESLTSDSDSSTDDEIEQDLEDDGTSANVRDGFWMRIMGEDIGPIRLPFTGSPGPNHALPTDALPIDYVKLFLDNHLIDILVSETNRYSDQWVANNQDYLRQKKYSRVHKWIREGHTSRDEMYAFLSIIINMGMIKKVTFESYHDTVNPSQSTPWFVDHINRDRLSLLKKFLHFSDNDMAPPVDDPEYKIYKVKNVIVHLLQKFRHYYVPDRDISIDESMVGYKGKTPHLRVYMPNKHHARFGVKLWCLCDSKTGYLYTFEVFKGAHVATDNTGEGVTYNLVMRLMETSGLLYQGYHLGLDNYFSSPRLFLDLFSKHTSATGTVRSNRKGLPKQVIKAKLKNKEVCERRKGNLLCVGYKDGSKQPTLLTTETSGGYTITRNSKNKERRVPMCVKRYNQAMGGVDLSDARLYAYLAERRTLKWTHKVVFSLIGRALLNAYIIYAANTTDLPVLTRYAFNIQVVESMMGNFRPPKKIYRKRRSKSIIEAARQTPQQFQPPESEIVPGPSQCKLVKLDKGKKRDCKYKHERRVRSCYECPDCDVGLCPECFAGYHLEKSSL